MSSLIDGDLTESDIFYTAGDFSDHRPSGILAALNETNKNNNSPRPFTYKKCLVFPKEKNEREYSRSVPKFFRSAPVSVPVGPVRVRGGDLGDVEDERDEEMLPPHEIVARGSSMMHTATFSVLEGVGRTLKGRDLRQVRNAVWRKTGFLD